MCISRFWLHGMVLPSEMEPSARRVSFIIVLIQQQQARNVYVERRSVSEYKVDMARTGKKVGRPAKKDLAGVRRQIKTTQNKVKVKNKLPPHAFGQHSGLLPNPGALNLAPARLRPHSTR